MKRFMGIEQEESTMSARSTSEVNDTASNASSVLAAIMLLVGSDKASMQRNISSISTDAGENFRVRYAYMKHRTSNFPFITGTHEAFVTVRNAKFLRFLNGKGACTP